MKLSEELLEIKNTEIRVLMEKLHEKDEFIRYMTIRYADYFADYEARYGNSISNYDSILGELYYTKRHYIDLLKQAYDDSGRKDKEKEELIKRQENELAVLKKEVNRLKKFKDQVIEIAEKGKNLEKSDDIPSLKDYVYNQSDLEEIERILRQHISPKLKKHRQALPIRAAHDAGKIKTIPFKDFNRIFPEVNLSDSTYNRITSETNEIPEKLKTEYQRLKEIFEALNTT